ncbi:hypothetical protein RND71_038656 [Anisodus tanguticus]|uniref:Uncharacterized protein n=1 Tax=Anisodus tanguticus TaxID=243964 RepID=A0AAE1R049_9SOLA|nr:hypothetical protein RND71_038656 [Anisodus tanguticus]
MQAKKSKQLLKARLARERQIYEMRKRAELKATVSEPERPWKVVEKAPTLFSVSADEHLRVLADRFEKPGGFDMWSDKDGPELFKPEDGLPSARFFPKGVVHSIRPYGKNAIDGSDEPLNSGSDSRSESDRKVRMKRNRCEQNSIKPRAGSSRERNEGYLDSEESDEVSIDGNNRKGKQNKFRNNTNRSKLSGHAEKFSSEEAGRFRVKNKSHRPADSDGEHGRFNLVDMFDDSESPVFELFLQNDGSYDLQPEN